MPCTVQFPGRLANHNRTTPTDLPTPNLPDTTAGSHLPQLCRVNRMTTHILEHGMQTADTGLHAVQNSSCCSNLIKKGPTYMSEALRRNGFLRTLFLAKPQVKFSQCVSSNTALELPISRTHPHSTTLAPYFLCTIAHTPLDLQYKPFGLHPYTSHRSSSICPNSVAPPPAQMVGNICWILGSLHSIGMHSVTQDIPRRMYCIAKYLFSFVLTRIVSKLCRTLET